DEQGAWGCGACHDECDRRTRLIDSDTARLYHAEGVMRTQYILRKEGKL
ncbi:TPA: nuclease domain-containing protein, partial [Yersinia enterocolitica]